MKALKRFDEVCYRPENHVIFKLKPGEFVSFDNYRIMHGRTGFKFQVEFPPEYNKKVCMMYDVRKFKGLQNLTNRDLLTQFV